MQVPLESILNGDCDGLHAVRTNLERERKLVAAKLVQIAQGGLLLQESGAYAGSPPSPFDSFAYHMDSFDSGIDTEPDNGSEVTVMDDSD